MQHKQQLVFESGHSWQVLAGEEAHLLEGVFKQCLPGNVDLDVAGQSIGLLGEENNVKGKSEQGYNDPVWD